MFDADSQNFASAPLASRGVELKNFWPAFGGHHQGTLGGGWGPSQPPPFPPPSNTSLGTGQEGRETCQGEGGGGRRGCPLRSLAQHILPLPPPPALREGRGRSCTCDQRDTLWPIDHAFPQGLGSSNGNHFFCGNPNETRKYQPATLPEPLRQTSPLDLRSPSGSTKRPVQKDARLLVPGGGWVCS